MKEKLIVALLIIFIIAIPISCIFIWYTSNKNTDTEYNDSGVFVEIESHLSYEIVYDKDTRVIYAKSNSGTMTFCPLYNADGTLKLYEENNDE